MAARMFYLGVVFLVACGGTQDGNPKEEAPEALTCIADWYGGEPTKVGGEWMLRFDDTTIPWDDGVDRDFDELVAYPGRIDLRDMVATPYETGRIRAPEGDPAYFVPPALYDAVWGATPQQVMANLADVRWLGKAELHDRTYTDAWVTVQDAMKEDVQGVAADLEEMVFMGGDLAHPAQPPVLARFVTGEQCCRGYVAEGDHPLIKGEIGDHAYGVALDLNLRYTDDWYDGVMPGAWHNQVPQAVVDTFEDHGFAWGGRAEHFRTGHFTWRPELFDERCRL